MNALLIISIILVAIVSFAAIVVLILLMKGDLFIKDSNGNYIKRAKMNERGELELL